MNAGTHQARDSNPFPPAHTSGGSHFMNPFPILMFPLPMKPLPNPFAIRTYNANRTASVQRLTGTAPNPSTIRTNPFGPMILPFHHPRFRPAAPLWGKAGFNPLRYYNWQHPTADHETLDR